MYSKPIELFMPCQILVSNRSNLPKAEMITVVSGDHVWSRNESMQSFIAAGGTFEDWPRTFSVVIVADKTADEVSYLLDYNDVGERKWYFFEAESGSSEFQELYLSGQVERDWSVISTFIGER